MKNIHLFETKDAYDEAKSSLILPRVSYIKENKVVDYNPHHDYVEIAGIKWATMNVGAKSITDYGLYFQWGDTQGYTAEQVGTGEGQKAFALSDYKWYDTEMSAFTKYNSTDKKIVLDLDDDAVHAAWGDFWRMPTAEEFQALGDAVTTTFVTDYNKSGVNGLLCTAKDGSNKTLFFPACGNAYDGSMSNVGISGSYWSSSLIIGNVIFAFELYFNSDGVIWQGVNTRYYGKCVRGVLDDR